MFNGAEATGLAHLASAIDRETRIGLGQPYDKWSFSAFQHDPPLVSRLLSSMHPLAPFLHLGRQRWPFPPVGGTRSLPGSQQNMRSIRSGRGRGTKKAAVRVYSRLFASRSQSPPLQACFTRYSTKHIMFFFRVVRTFVLCFFFRLSKQRGESCEKGRSLSFSLGLGLGLWSGWGRGSVYART